MVSLRDGCAAGLRTDRRSDRDGARDDLEDEPAVGAGVDLCRTAEPAHRADHAELVLAAFTSDRAGWVDQSVAAALRQPDRVDRLAAGPDLGDPRTLLEGDAHPRPGDEIDHGPEHDTG